MVDGIVYLVGAGPGDPGLMTRRSVELIATADAVLYDRLIPPGALEGARPDAELRYVGKEPGRAAMEQEELNALLVELGRAGQRVVRLKGGDPFVFGRGGEEAEALAAAGVSFEVVPGVTAGVAAPAYAGIPVTHRDTASAVAFVTGHQRDDARAIRAHSAEPSACGTADLDWEALARFPGTLVLYMGISQLPQIAERLIAGRRDPADPAAVVERGTLPGQRTVIGPLAEISSRVADAGLRPPAVTVIGPVAGLRATLAWLERRPLHGQVVAVTRARAQAGGLAATLRELGADVLEAPAIRIEPRAVDPPDPSAYDLICFTSPSGVRLFFAALTGDARSLARSRVAAIGPGTAGELRRHGIRADLVPERFVAEGLLEALPDVRGERVLVARAAEARDVLLEGLRERGAAVDVLALYDTVAEPLSADQRRAIRGASYVTFTSSSTVRFFLSGGGAVADGARVVSIGPVTSATLREHGIEPHVEAERHDIDGLVRAIVEDVGR
ncbi:MAG: uroporphyrinogen-III C-methyltransferase [Thermoleophilaceae bacterium]